MGGPGARDVILWRRGIVLPMLVQVALMVNEAALWENQYRKCVEPLTQKNSIAEQANMVSGHLRHRAGLL